MWLAILVYQLATLALARAQNDCLGNPSFREPAKLEMDVVCGTEMIELQMLLCPIYFCGYNESLMALNANYLKEQCRGTPDWTVDPPVLKFNFSIKEEAITACSNKLVVTEEVGTGVFSDFSNVQFMNISGIISSVDTDKGAITYKEEMMYKFSCRYPLQYLANKTDMSVTGVSLAIKENNGSFISTLSMKLYSDRHFKSALYIPDGGLHLKTRIFVEVKATNLTNRFNVLLDRCYATTTPFHMKSTFYDLFVGCKRDGQTVIGVNGLEQEARFSFEAFRFVQHKNRSLSTFYLHCATRLCQRSFCSDLIQNCTTNINNSRRRRNAAGDSTTVSDEATITSGPIKIRSYNGDPVESEAAQQTRMKGTVLIVAIVAGTVGVLCISLAAFIAYHIHNSKSSFTRTTLYPQ